MTRPLFYSIVGTPNLLKYWYTQFTIQGFKCWESKFTQVLGPLIYYPRTQLLGHSILLYLSQILGHLIYYHRTECWDTNSTIPGQTVGTLNLLSKDSNFGTLNLPSKDSSDMTLNGLICWDP